MIHLIDLFKVPSELIVELDSRAWYNEPIKDESGYYNYIYCWVNLDTQWCYVGKHKSYNPFNDENYLGSSSNPHYWNSRSKHEFKCIILSYTDNEEENKLLEYMIIDTDLVNKFSNRGLFNLVPGGYGKATQAAWDASFKTRRLKYPDTNGAPIEWIMAGAHAPRRKKRTKPDGSVNYTYNPNGIIRKRELYKDDPNFIGGVMPWNCIRLGAETHSQNSIIRTINNYIQDLINKGLDITPYNYYNNTYAGKNMWLQHIPRVLKRLSELKSHPDWTDLMTEIFDHIIPNLDTNAKGYNRYLIK